MHNVSYCTKLNKENDVHRNRKYFLRAALFFSVPEICYVFYIQFVICSMLRLFVLPVLQIVVQALQCSHYSILWQLVKITEGSPSKVSRQLIT